MLNMKGGTDFLRYYRLKEDVYTEEVRMLKGKETPVKIKNKLYVDEDFVINFKFEEPALGGFINKQYTNISNYILHVWSYYLGKDATYTLIQIISRIYGEKEITYLSKSTIQDIIGVKHTTTLENYLKPLEKYRFLFQFYCENVNKNNMQEDSIYVVRNSVPLLSKELYDNLPPKIKKEADKIVSDLFNGSIVYSDINYEQSSIYEKLGINPIKFKIEDVTKSDLKIISEKLFVELDELYKELLSVSYDMIITEPLQRAYIENRNIIIPFSEEIYMLLFEKKKVYELAKKHYEKYINIDDLKLITK